MVRPPPPPLADFLRECCAVIMLLQLCFGTEPLTVMSDVHTVVFPGCLQLRTVWQPGGGGGSVVSVASCVLDDDRSLQQRQGNCRQCRQPLLCQCV